MMIMCSFISNTAWLEAMQALVEEAPQDSGSMTHQKQSETGGYDTIEKYVLEPHHPPLGCSLSEKWCLHFY